MAKRVKSEWLGARIDKVLDAQVTEYIKSAELTMGELVRNATIEYMLNHPVKKLVSTPSIKPGE